MCSLVVAAVTGMTAYACEIQIRVACPNDRAAAGVKVTVAGVGSVTTDSLGIATIDVPDFGTYTVSVDPATLPAGATLNPLQQKIKVLNNATPVAEFVLGGDFCDTPPPHGECWLTGGGTIGKIKGALNPKLSVEGGVLTMFDSRMTLSNQVKDEVSKFFGPSMFETVIPRNIRIAEAPGFGQSIFQYDPKSRGAEAYLSLAKELLARRGHAPAPAKTEVENPA